MTPEQVGQSEASKKAKDALERHESAKGGRARSPDRRLGFVPAVCS
jgi:hypothetical protein